MLLRIDGRQVELIATYLPTGDKGWVAGISGGWMQLHLSKEVAYCVKCGAEKECAWPIVSLEECDLHLDLERKGIQDV